MMNGLRHLKPRFGRHWLLMSLGFICTGLTGQAQAAPQQCAKRLTIAAAADLRFALADLLQSFAARQQLSSAQLADVIYGSSGKLTSQILQGAPYDMILAADPRFTEQLFQAQKTTSAGTVYAQGRLVLWSQTQAVSAMPLAELTEERFRYIAIAQPSHAPYGERAQQVLQRAGLWQSLQPKLVYGENVAQSAQLVQSGVATAAFIALSLAKHQSMAKVSGANYQLIDASWHQPLRQTVALTHCGAEKVLAKDLLLYLQSDQARQIFQHYGFEPGQSNAAQTMPVQQQPPAATVVH